MRSERKGRGIGLRELAKRTATEGYSSSLGTLSGMENGRVPRRDRGRDRVLEIERALDVPAGQLLRLTVSPRPTRGGNAASGRSHPSGVEGAGEQDLEHRKRNLENELAHRWGVDRHQLIIVEQSEHLQIGDDRGPVRSDITLTVTAVDEPVSSYWYLQQVGPFTRTTIHSLDERCAVGRILHDPLGVQNDGGELVATELRFTQPFTGGGYGFAFSVRWDRFGPGSPLPKPGFRRFLPSTGCRHLQLMITFDPLVRPIRLLRCKWKSANDLERVEKELRGSTDSIDERNPRPGGYGWTWQWPRPDQIAPRPYRRRTGRHSPSR